MKQTETLEGEQSTMRSELAKKENFTEELKGENEVATYVVILHIYVYA